MNDDRRTRLAGHYVAKHFLSKLKPEDQDFWNANYGIISNLSTIEAILGERTFFFEQKPSRSNGFSLVMTIDLAWQLMRSLANIQGKDENWVIEYIQEPTPQIINGMVETHDFFEEEKNIIGDILWVYGIHSVIRHPKQVSDYQWIFFDPWPDEISIRLIKAARGIDAVLFALSQPFSFSGWEDEVNKRKNMMDIAAAEWHRSRGK